MICRILSASGSEYSADCESLLIRTSPFEQCVQIMVPGVFRKRIMYLTYNTEYVGHPSSSYLYSTLGRLYYSYNIVGDVQD